jgi:hypothetical protein
MRIPSDLDLAVLTRRDLAHEERDELLDATYPLYLECGRQIGPAIVETPSESLAAAIARDGVRVWPS